MIWKIGKWFEFNQDPIRTIYFRRVCPNCDELMKFLRETGEREFYSCFSCFKSWLYEKSKTEDGKIIAKYTETEFRNK